MDAFVETHRVDTEETVIAYEEELERMLDLKRQRMGAFIGNAREEITKLWDELMAGEEERNLLQVVMFIPSTANATSIFSKDEHT
jgi:protein regulator of cytokinesis 1